MRKRALNRIFDCILASLPQIGSGQPSAEDIAAAVEENLNRQPWPPRLFATLAAILISGGRPSEDTLRARLTKWRQSRWSWQSAPMRFFDAMAAIYALNRPEPSPSPKLQSWRAPARLWPKCVEVAVVGSGPGGSVTASTLANAGLEILLLEEGEKLHEGAVSMTHPDWLKYLRYGGATPTVGNAGTALLEGRCLGGASEINSGLYVKPDGALLDEWNTRFGVALAADELEAHYRIIEGALGIEPTTHKPIEAASRLRLGAEGMDWRVADAFKMVRNGQGGAVPATMSRTFLADAAANGAQIETASRVNRLHRNGRLWTLSVSGGGSASDVEVMAQNVFLAAGAIQTPKLLRQSGLARMAGNQLSLQPVAEIVAEFAEPVNHDQMGVPGAQVHEFAPDMLMGLGVSSPARIAMALANYPDVQRQLGERWRNMAVYTVILGRTSSARILFPGWGGTLIYHSLSKADWHTLGLGLKRLSQLLIKAGARRLYPVGDRALPMGPDESGDAFAEVPGGFKPRLQSVHLTSSCPMGERGAASVCNSYGEIHGFPGLYLADASLLCASPAVNPQALIMAVVHRNACHFVEQMVQLNGANAEKDRAPSETIQ